MLTLCGVSLGDCRQPPHCVPETYTNATSWYKVFTTVRDSDTKYSQDYNPFWCYKGAIGKVYHTLNPKLTVIVPDVSYFRQMDASYLFFFFVLSSIAPHTLLLSFNASFSLLGYCLFIIFDACSLLNQHSNSHVRKSELCSEPISVSNS